MMFIPLHLLMGDGKSKLTWFNVQEIMHFFSSNDFEGAKTCVVAIHDARFYVTETTDFILELIGRHS